MFDNPLLELLSRVHPVVPPLIYLPVITLCLVLAVGREGSAWRPSPGCSCSGSAAWSLAEYLLHRFVFHFQPDTRWGRRLHFIIHGVHHDYPHDPMRLVMPPSVSVPLAILTSSAFALLLGPEWSLPVFAGFLVGYLIYDMTHFHIHHHRATNKLSLRCAATTTATTSSSPTAATASRRRCGTGCSAPTRSAAARRLAPSSVSPPASSRRPSRSLGRVDVEEQPLRIAEARAARPRSTSTGSRPATVR